MFDVTFFKKQRVVVLDFDKLDTYHDFEFVLFSRELGVDQLASEARLSCALPTTCIRASAQERTRIGGSPHQDTMSPRSPAACATFVRVGTPTLEEIIPFKVFRTSTECQLVAWRNGRCWHGSATSPI
jgi:hypothetical protein